MFATRRTPCVSTPSATWAAWTPRTHLAYPRPAGDDLLEAAVAGPEDRVVAIGGERADLLCAALHRGCRSAIGMVVAERHPEPADIVVASRVTTQEQALAAAECARRALRGAVRRGRFALGLVGADAASLARSLQWGLVGYGFTRPLLWPRVNGGLLLVCEFRADGAQVEGH
ncbi:MAG: hypothetical protein MUC51_13825 [Anaerolineae bacterium]|nr:hypothetical protein [Anaerolineae bacterium]